MLIRLYLAPRCKLRATSNLTQMRRYNLVNAPHVPRSNMAHGSHSQFCGAPTSYSGELHAQGFETSDTPTWQTQTRIPSAWAEHGGNPAGASCEPLRAASRSNLATSQVNTGNFKSTRAGTASEPPFLRGQHNPLCPVVDEPAGYGSSPAAKLSNSGNTSFKNNPTLAMSVKPLRTAAVFSLSSWDSFLEPVTQFPRLPPSLRFNSSNTKASSCSNTHILPQGHPEGQLECSTTRSSLTEHRPAEHLHQTRIVAGINGFKCELPTPSPANSKWQPHAELLQCHTAPATTRGQPSTTNGQSSALSLDFSPCITAVRVQHATQQLTARNISLPSGAKQFSTKAAAAAKAAEKENKQPPHSSPGRRTSKDATSSQTKAASKSRVALADVLPAERTSGAKKVSGVKRPSTDPISGSGIAQKAKRDAITSAAGLSELSQSLGIHHQAQAVNAGTTSGMAKLEQELGQEDTVACVMAVLYEARVGEVVQYYSSITGLTRAQQLALRKARRAGAATAEQEEAGEVEAVEEKAASSVALATVCPFAKHKPVGVGIIFINGDTCEVMQLKRDDRDTSVPSRQAQPRLFFLPLDPDCMTSQTSNKANPVDPATMQVLLTSILGGQSDPMAKRINVIAANAKQVLRELVGWDVAMPQPTALRLIDPLLVEWIHEPQLAQRDEKEISGYSVEELAERNKLGYKDLIGDSVGKSGATAMAVLRQGMVLTSHLTASLEEEVKKWAGEDVAGLIVGIEFQVQGILADMEARGVACNLDMLEQHQARVKGRMDQLRRDAIALVGVNFNIGSNAQLSGVLYEHLKLKPPRAVGKRHASTDEISLRALMKQHALPAMVLEYRALQMMLSKWLDGTWVARARQSPRESGGQPRVHCYWNQTATATGRLSSSHPNMQAVTRSAAQPLDELSSDIQINIRDAFVAPKGRVLLSADYSQIELRILAHYSNDPKLCGLLQRADTQADPFSLIASSWLVPGTPPGQVSREDREKAKRVTYGIIYGLTPYGLANMLNNMGLPQTQEQADKLITTFLDTFSGVKAFMDRAVAQAQEVGYVTTLLGRRRLIKGLETTNPRVKSEAVRKVVNSIIQGSAADIIKLAMVEWSNFQSLSERKGGSPAHLIAQIHDELLFEVDDNAQAKRDVCQRVQNIMEKQGLAAAQVELAVPLRVSLEMGTSWGSMQEMNKVQ